MIRQYIMIPDRRSSSKTVKSRLRESVLSSRSTLSISHKRHHTRHTKHQATQNSPKVHISTALEVILKNVPPLRLRAILLNNDTRAPHDLTGVALPVDLAEASPGPEDLRVSDLDQRDFVGGTESLDELDVLRFGTGLDEDTEVGLATVEGLRAFAETPGETVVYEGSLQDLLFACNYPYFQRQLLV